MSQIPLAAHISVPKFPLENQNFQWSGFLDIKSNGAHMESLKCTGKKILASQPPLSRLSEAGASLEAHSARTYIKIHSYMYLKGFPCLNF